MKYALLACLLGAGLTAPAYSQNSTGQQADDTGAYIALGVATSRNPYNSGTTLSLKLSGGYDFNRTWGLEAGRSGQRFQGSLMVADVNGNSYIAVPTTIHNTSNYLAGKATLPVNDLFSIVTKMGVAVNRSKFSVKENADVYNLDSRSTKYGLYASIGMKYQLTDKVAISLDLERMGRRTSGRHNPEAASLNASYSF